MNLKRIQDILAVKDLPDGVKETMIINVLADDKKVIPMIMKILERERDVKEDLIGEMNLLLSQADVIIETPKLNTERFFHEKVMNFYEQFKGYVGHCFRTPEEGAFLKRVEKEVKKRKKSAGA